MRWTTHVFKEKFMISRTINKLQNELMNLGAIQVGSKKKLDIGKCSYLDVRRTIFTPSANFKAINVGAPNITDYIIYRDDGITHTQSVARINIAAGIICIRGLSLVTDAILDISDRYRIKCSDDLIHD